MKILNPTEANYDIFMDKEVISLCNAINSLPGIKTNESCCGHNKRSFLIFFRVFDRFDGLFFLTRCVDKRYWKYGDLWKIDLSVGDHFSGKELPISFLLHSGSIIGKEAEDQSNDLVENMNHHLNHVNFINYYKLNVNDFGYIER